MCLEWSDIIYQNLNKNLRYVPMTFASDSSEMTKFRKIDNVVMIYYIYTRGVQPEACDVTFYGPRKIFAAESGCQIYRFDFQISISKQVSILNLDKQHVKLRFESIVS